MKKKLKIERLKQKNAKLQAMLEEKQAMIDKLLDEREQSEKDMQFMRGEIYAFELIHSNAR